MSRKLVVGKADARDVTSTVPHNTERWPLVTTERSYILVRRTTS
jgi:hypothetical protein